MSYPKQIVTPQMVDLAHVSFGTPKKLDNGGRLVPVYYQGSPFVLQTPPMRTPYGLNAWTQERSNGEEFTKYSLNLSIDTKNDTSKMYELLMGLDARILQDACQNSTTWLNKNTLSAEVAKALYTPMVKVAKDKTTGEGTDAYPPTFKVALPYADGKFTCEFYDAQRNAIVLDTIPKRSTVTAICQCTGIWVAGGKFGCNWKVLQLRYTPPADNGVPKGYAFVAEEDTD